ncbi:hypothetical protein DRN69_00085 [Candidatus Pacearchaeota archaeon]|nr:MAG: hypothetical protein DRN69_00085 [Candidatus Pacearchaeota archaeon]
MKFKCPICNSELELKKVKNEVYEHLYNTFCNKCGIEWEIKGYFIYKTHAQGKLSELLTNQRS